MLEILAAYGVEPKMLALQKHFWDTAKLVCRAGGNYGEAFSAERGIAQRGSLSSLMFSMCVDAIVKAWLHQTLSDEAVHNGFGDGTADCDPVWLQESFDVLLGLFEWIGLFTNAVKMKVMVCISGKVREGYTEEEEYACYKSPSETAADRKHRHVDCEICGTSLADESYKSHLESQHDVFHSIVLQRDKVVDCPPVVYHAIESLGTYTYICPVLHCIGGVSKKWALRWHFLFHHPQDLVVLPSEGTVPFLRCKRCGMQTKVCAFYGKHWPTRLCHEG